MSTPPLPPGGRRIFSARERAPFVPIDPKLDLDALIEQQPNFQSIPRVDASTLDSSPDGPNLLEDIIYKHVIVAGLPLVIEGWHLRSDWPKWLFNPEWLQINHGRDPVSVRDLVKAADIPMSLGHYLRNLGKLTDKFSSADYNSKQQRLYGKDLDCPPVWQSSLASILPNNTFYLAPAADLMSSLPPPARAENMMCYIGHEGTYTPAHKEMCASLGQNIMVHTSSGQSEPGSSIWFMTSSADREVIAEYWLSHLGHDIEVESHFASIDDLRDAPFNVYIHEQKLGDYILVPPLAPHQVWNRGETTIKAAWNRTVIDTLELAIAEALPKARLVCRDEQYKNRAIIHETLKKYARVFRGDDYAPEIPLDRLQRDFQKLYKLFDKILLNESFYAEPKEKLPVPEKIENEYNVTCSFCRGNIWNRFLSCQSCIPPTADGEDDDCYDVCMDCYARGRSCGCVSRLKWVEQHYWHDLERDHEEFREIILGFQTTMTDETPKSLKQGLKELGRKTVARVCQEQLKVRPFVDILKNGLEDEEDETMDIAQQKKAGLLLNCHVCKIRHPKWKCAECTTCTKVYCYGNLWRAFDMDPFDDILAKFDWKCPVCLGICSCGACRKRDDMQPYEPKGTFIGASTKHVADPRSVETLVDFARGNLGWIKDVDTERNILKRKRESLASDGDGHRVLGTATHESFTSLLDGRSNSEMDEGAIPIDPALETGSESNENHDDYPTNNEVHQPNYGATDSPSAGPNGTSSADMEGRFQPAASISGGEDNGSNAYGSLQALSTAALRTAEVQRTGHLEGKEAGQTGEQGEVGEAAVGLRGFDPPLPSPSAMLTGALPAGRQDSSLISSHNATSTNITQNNTPSNYFNSYPDHSNNYPPSTSEIYAHQHSLGSSTYPDMSSLERNPHAFLAAAGLLEPPNAVPASSSYAQAQQHASPSASWNPINDTPLTQPSLLQNSPPPIVEPRPRKKHPPLPLKDRVKSDIPIGTQPIAIDRSIAVGDWVKKTKKMRQKAKNLERKKRFLIKIKMPIEKFRAWHAQQMGIDLVTSDLVIAGRTAPIKIFTSKDSRENSAAPKKSGRSAKGYYYISESDSEEDEKEEVFLKDAASKRKSRRESAWAVRKREEEEAYNAFLESHRDAPAASSSGGRIPSERKRNKHHAVGLKEVLGVLNPRESDSPSSTPVNIATDEDAEAEIDDDPLPPPPSVEKTEEQRLERETAEAEDATRKKQAAQEEAARREKLVREREVRLEQLAQVKAARHAAAVEEAVRRRVEEKRRKEEDRERRRKEADRKAKLVAAGLLSEDEVEDYVSEEEDDLADEPPVMLELEDSNDSGQFLWTDLNIPEEWSWAVVINNDMKPMDWRQNYEVFPAERESPVPSLIELPTVDTVFSTPTVPPKRKRGRPRKEDSLKLPASASKAIPKKDKRTAQNRRKSLTDLKADDGAYRTWEQPNRGKSRLESTKTSSKKTEEPKRRRSSRALTTPRYADANADIESDGEVQEEIIFQRSKKRRRRTIPIGEGRYAEVEIEDDDDDVENEVARPPTPPPPPVKNPAPDLEAVEQEETVDYEYEFERRWGSHRRNSRR